MNRARACLCQNCNYVQLDTLYYINTYRLLYYFNRAFFLAGAAAGTFCIVNDCKVILHCDCALWTVSLTQTTSDTACAADRLHILTEFLRVTLDDSTGIFRYHLDDMSRTGKYTLSTRLTFVLVHDCHAIYDGNCFKLAGTLT